MTSADAQTPAAAPRRDAAWQDLVLGLGFVALGLYAAYRINVLDKPVFGLSTGPLDYATVPTIASLGMAALALIYVAGAARKLIAGAGARQGDAPAAPRASWRVVGRRLGTFGLLAAYVAAMKDVPFFAATAVFLAAMFVLYGQTSPLRVAAVSLIGAGALYGLFVVALRLPL